MFLLIIRENACFFRFDNKSRFDFRFVCTEISIYQKIERILYITQLNENFRKLKLFIEIESHL